MSKITTSIAAIALASLLAFIGCDKKTECEICNTASRTEEERMIMAKGLNPVYITLNIPDRTKSTVIKTIDLFAFTEKTGNMETWRHFSSIDQMEQSALAIGDGIKTFVILVNAIEDFSHVENLKHLVEMQLDSRDHSLESRYWCVEEMEISGPQCIRFQVKLYQAIINIRRIKVDFSNDVLRNLSIRDVKTAILDIPSSISICGASDIKERFNNGVIQYKEFYKELGDLRHGDNISCMASFMVSPKCDGVDEPGNRAVRAAIYGLFNGERRWWSIPVNMGYGYEQIYGPAGICANTIYDLDITITGAGTDDPYDTSGLCNADIICNVQKWSEQDYSIVF